MITADEAKDEVVRLLLNPLQIGSVWKNRHRSFGDFSVVLHGVEHGYVHVRDWKSHTAHKYRILDFHVNFAPFQFPE